ncbi:MAG: hypothetical protein MZV64_24035 [Ignavibacteriales bacterium]|nr:hypothetical protein [Ignavibacteriales bacterium]
MVNQLNIGYYEWRKGEISQVTFEDGASLTPRPHAECRDRWLLHDPVLTPPQPERMAPYHGRQQRILPPFIGTCLATRGRAPKRLAISSRPGLKQPFMTLPIEPRNHVGISPADRTAPGVPMARWRRWILPPATETTGCYVSRLMGFGQLPRASSYVRGMAWSS